MRMKLHYPAIWVHLGDLASVKLVSWWDATALFQQLTNGFSVSGWPKVCLIVVVIVRCWIRAQHECYTNEDAKEEVLSNCPSALIGTISLLGLCFWIVLIVHRVCSSFLQRRRLPKLSQLFLVPVSPVSKCKAYCLVNFYSFLPLVLYFDFGGFHYWVQGHSTLWFALDRRWFSSLQFFTRLQFYADVARGKSHRPQWDLHWSKHA